MCIVLVCLCAALCAVGTAQAQLISDPMDTDQYHVVERSTGVLRIDRRTGDISECERSTNGWVCRLTADDRAAYEAEINRLDAQVERLENELELAEQALEDAEDSRPLLRDQDEVRQRLDLPTDEEIDAVMNSAEQMMRRFMDMVEDLRRDIEQQRGE